MSASKPSMEDAGRRLPSATYRLQFNRSFTFTAAAGIVPYLHALGVTDCYASSYLKAVPGSLHGYDIVDPTVLNPEIGTEEELREFVHVLRQHGMGHILDVVPNHMGIGQSANRWWQDVLENGPSSRYADLFDIDWSPVKRELEGKVLLPVLGDLYGTVLENQEIMLAYDDGGFRFRYYDHTLPVAPKSWIAILTHRLDDLIARDGADAPHVREVQSIVTALRHLPSRSEVEPERVSERYREKEIARQRLATLVKDSPAIEKFVADNVRLFNGTRGEPGSFDLLDALLGDQAYRLAYWRVASEEINYRRFFDINELAAIRMENEAVLSESHALIFRLLKEGSLSGIRIDHVDGLYDPGRYLRHLQEWAGQELSGSGRPPGDGGRSLFLVVEKILDTDEPLPTDWPVAGTTGYEFLNQLNGLFVQSAYERAMDDIYARFIGRRIGYDDLVYETKKLIMNVSMSSEINVLGHQLNRLSERDRRTRDFTLNSLTDAIREIIACFPVYRTYVTDGTEPVSDRDRAYIRLAGVRAKRRNPAVSGLVFDYVRSLLLKEWDERIRQDRSDLLRFVMKFQQTTSPVTAKGIEDTANYIYNRLVSLNEVGGDPKRFGVPPALFHDRMRERRALWPHALSTTTTHDTKRSEDVRARINVLSEMPLEWKAHLHRWHRLNKKHATVLEGLPAPGRNEEYLLYQTLVGAWPLTPMDEGQSRSFCDRIQAYMSKALKEAKQHSSWMNPDQAYEQATAHFVEEILDRSGPNHFLEDFLPFQDQIARYGLCNSLSQVLVKITAPGIPDFYQGTETWDFSLVDPDNRRPVDFAARAAVLEELERVTANADSDGRSWLVRELMASCTDGRIKLYLTMTALNFRRAHAALFQDGDYLPMDGQGTRRDHVCAFARQHKDRPDQSVLTVVPRLVAGLMEDSGKFPLGADVWRGTVLPVPSSKRGSRYRNVLTGAVLATVEAGGTRVLPLADIFRDCPVALLERMA